MFLATRNSERRGTASSSNPVCCQHRHFAGEAVAKVQKKVRLQRLDLLHNTYQQGQRFSSKASSLEEGLDYVNKKGSDCLAWASEVSVLCSF